jgi:hypothetical protein
VDVDVAFAKTRWQAARNASLCCDCEGSGVCGCWSMGWGLGERLSTSPGDDETAAANTRGERHVNDREDEAVVEVTKVVGVLSGCKCEGGIIPFCWGQSSPDDDDELKQNTNWSLNWSQHLDKLYKSYQ